MSRASRWVRVARLPVGGGVPRRAPPLPRLRCGSATGSAWWRTSAASWRDELGRGRAAGLGTRASRASARDLLRPLPPPLAGVRRGLRRAAAASGPPGAGGPGGRRGVDDLRARVALAPPQPRLHGSRWWGCSASGIALNAVGLRRGRRLPPPPAPLSGRGPAGPGASRHLRGRLDEQRGRLREGGVLEPGRLHPGGGRRTRDRAGRAGHPGLLRRLRRPAGARARLRAPRTRRWAARRWPSSATPSGRAASAPTRACSGGPSGSTRPTMREGLQSFTIVGVLPRDFWYLNGYTNVLAPCASPGPCTWGGCARTCRPGGPRRCWPSGRARPRAIEPAEGSCGCAPSRTRTPRRSVRSSSRSRAPPSSCSWPPAPAPAPAPGPRERPQPGDGRAPGPRGGTGPAGGPPLRRGASSLRVRARVGVGARLGRARRPRGRDRGAPGAGRARGHGGAAPRRLGDPRGSGASAALVGIRARRRLASRSLYAAASIGAPGEGARGAETAGAGRVRAALVATAGGALRRAPRRRRAPRALGAAPARMELGFDPEGLEAYTVGLTSERAGRPGITRGLLRGRCVRRTEELPGVAAAGLARAAPFVGALVTRGPSRSRGGPRPSRSRRWCPQIASPGCFACSAWNGGAGGSSRPTTAPEPRRWPS